MIDQARSLDRFANSAAQVGVSLDEFTRKALFSDAFRAAKFKVLAEGLLAKPITETPI